MKASLRLTVQIIAVVIVLFLAIPIFLPDNVTIKSSTEINAPVHVVFLQVNTLKKRKAWSPFENDSTMKNTYSGPVKGVGAQRTWVSERLGKGHMAITNCIPDRLIETKLDFGTPGTVEGHWTFADNNGHTTVQWQLHILKLNYPLGRWVGTVLKKMMKPVLEKGLNHLKAVAEEQGKNGMHTQKK